MMKLLNDIHRTMARRQIMCFDKTYIATYSLPAIRISEFEGVRTQESGLETFLHYSEITNLRVDLRFKL